jgi:hypothetical protein
VSEKVRRRSQRRIRKNEIKNGQLVRTIMYSSNNILPSSRVVSAFMHIILYYAYI